MNRHSKELSDSQKEKYYTIIKYIANIYPGIGKVQLAKLLFAIDRKYYALHQKTITQDDYIKNYYGPTPCNIDKITKDLENNGFVSFIKEPVYDYPMSKMYPCKGIETASIDKYLLAGEVSFIHSCADRVLERTARSLFDETHQSIYHALELGDHIPDYMLPHYDDEPLTEGELSWAKEQAAEINV